jgi:hypothetical protein
VTARTVRREPTTADEIFDAAQAWFDRQMAKAANAHGDRWPKHRDWVADYLQKELRLALIARGWKEPPT